MRTRWWRGKLDGLLEEPYGSRAEECQHRGPSEYVHIRHQGGLLLHQAVNQAEGAGARLGLSDVMSKVAG